MKITAILLLSLILNLIESYIVIPFKGNNLTQIFSKTRNMDLEDFMKITYNNQYYTSFEIGQPNQHVVISLIPNETNFLFNKKNCDDFSKNKYIDKNSLIQNTKAVINISSINGIGYKKNLSRSFSNNNISYFVDYKGNYYLGKDIIKLNDYRNVLSGGYDSEIIFPYNQINLETASFVYEELNIGDTGNDNEICGSIGLTLYYDKTNTKFIEQIKRLNITNNYYWSMNYSSLDKGYIIFGILPHEYNPFKYNEEYLKEIYSKMDECQMKWAMALNEIYFFSNENKKVSVPNSISEGEFEFNLQLIIGSYEYQELIITHFFKYYFDINICKEEEIQLDIKYSIIICKKEQFEPNLQKFPNLYLYNREFKNSFVLSYNDLFINLGNYIYFLVVFRKGFIYKFNQIWKLGVPFLKKHQIIFNSDTKKIGYYVENEEEIETTKQNSSVNDNKSKKDNNKTKNNSENEISKINILSLRTFLEIIIVLIFILVVICFVKKIYTYKNRQKKPFELQDEEYDYENFVKNKGKDYSNIN